MRKRAVILAMMASLAVTSVALSATGASASTKLPPVITVHGTPRMTILTDKGNGPADTPKFNVPGTVPYWQVNWSYNCHPAGMPGNFDWTVYTLSGMDTNDFGPNQLSWGYSASIRYQDSGTFYLDVTADQGCVWEVQIVVPATPSYTVRIDQTWWWLSWTNGGGSSNPYQVKVTFTNYGPGPATFSNEPSLTVTHGKTVWTGQPYSVAGTYQCNGSNLANELQFGHTVRPGGSLTGCVVFDVPVAAWPHPGNIPAKVPMRLQWSLGGKTYQIEFLSV